MKINYKRTSGGQAVILTVIFFLIISIAVIAAVVVPTTNQVRSVRELMRSKAGYLAADAVNADAYYRVGLGKTLPSSMSLPFANGITATAAVTTSGGITQVKATGVNLSATRYAQSTMEQGQKVGMPYALSTGTGGVFLGGGSYVFGDIYTNGNITMDTSTSYVTGNATAANTTPPVIDQTNSYTNGASPVSVTVGNAAGTEDIAQSFQVTSATGVTFVRLYLKVTGYIGSDSTVRIIKDVGGKPGKNTDVVGTGTLKANTVTSSFTYVYVPITGLPSLTPGATYWVVIDQPSNQSYAYYTFAATNNTYGNGVAKSGQWSSGSYVTWNAVTPANSDLYFDIFLGGNPSTIAGADQYNRLRVGTGGSGSAWAYEINAVSSQGGSYCQLGSYLYDLSGNVGTCNITKAAPATMSYPITATQITGWQTTAATSVQNGSYTLGGGATATSGPKKIVGNLTVTGGSTLYITGPVWVTGTITVNGGSFIKMQASAGASGGIIIADGTISVTGGGKLQGSGTAGSYMMAISNSTSASAISVDGGAGSVILVALNGTVNLSGGGAANDVVSKQFNMTGGSHVTYDPNLAGLNFVGTTGGTWKVDTWAEVAQ